MKYIKLVELYEKLESTTKKLKKIDLLSKFLSEVDKELLPAVVLMTLGTVFPGWSEKELGVGFKLLVKAMSIVSGISANKIEEKIAEEGDVGLAAEKLFKKRRQVTFITQPLTVEKVYTNLKKVADITGEGAQTRKINLITDILSLAKPKEAKYLTRMILEELRVGVGEGIMRDAIAKAFKVDPKIVERAHMLTNDLGLVAKVACEKGVEGLKQLSLKPGRPVKPMLAQTAPSIKKAIEEMGKAFCETKYDGIRVQIHRKNSEIVVFTRRLENITNAVPDIVDAVEKALPKKDFIVEGEIIGVKNGRPIPFQYLLHRIRRKYEIEKAIKEIPFTLFLFDVLYFENPLIDEKFENRRKILESITKTKEGKVELSRKVEVTCENIDDAEKLFKESIEAGHEGIMIKDPNAPYIPGIRGKKMLKYKAEPETLDLVVIGGDYGEGKRAHLVGSYLVAARDEDTGELKPVAHVATGLDDDTLKNLTERMERIMVNKKGKKIEVEPKIILEVAFSEIVKSPEYESGYSLRFPVVKRIRDDLSLEDVDTVQRIESMYKKKFG
ncbi:DNA ligase I, ATP-dependent Dnl1 [Methanothermus fervidus DSM 2088]|uniref:DNA ligase n=1 Tax=Methanothermus fervidus (strain ATCC 43054 / DSM 2088 / JCM 10308 / V24 S) TaxID=523846 RepID=E3GYC3_METFV|nr:ATP-dependent DNA ligase [Methanothermus fervidus]ADP77305.1 DNA ligase I, ATP-dependent Dnl1 [Methanothermus fervidus DSM 2088]